MSDALVGCDQVKTPVHDTDNLAFGTGIGARANADTAVGIQLGVQGDRLRPE